MQRCIVVAGKKETQKKGTLVTRVWDIMLKCLFRVPKETLTEVDSGCSC